MGVREDKYQQRAREDKRGLGRGGKLPMKVIKGRDFARDATYFEFHDPNTGGYYRHEVNDMRDMGRTPEDHARYMDEMIEMARMAMEERDTPRSMREEMEHAERERFALKQKLMEAAMKQQHMEDVARYRAMEAAGEETYDDDPSYQRRIPSGGSMTTITNGQTNKIKATVHKAGHFPTNWMVEATTRAGESDKLVTIAVVGEGVEITAQEAGEKFASHVITWQAMEHAEVNPLILAIEDVEHKLDLLQDLKKRVGA